MAKFRALKSVALTVLLLLVPRVAGLGQDVPTTFQPERCLPHGTMAYAVIPDLEAGKARFKETAVYKIWSEPQVQAFAAPIKDWLSRQFDKLKKEFSDEVGLPVDDLYPAFTGQIAIALMTVNPGKPVAPGDPPKEDRPDVIEAVLFLTPKEPEPVRAILKTLQAYALKRTETARVSEVRHGDIAITELSDEANPSDPIVAYCWLGSTLAISVGAPNKTMQGIIDRWRGTDKNTLLTDQTFVQTQERVRVQERDFFLYVSVQEILRAADPFIEEDVRRPLEAGGAYSLRAVSYGLRFDGPAFRDIIYLRTAPEKKGFVNALSPATLDAKVLDLVPAEATTCVATRFNPDLLWRTIDAFVKSFGEKDYGDFRSGIEKADEYMGTKIEEEIIPAFGDYAVLYSQPTQAMPMLYGLLDYVLIVHMKDKAKAEVAAELLRQKTTDLALEQAQRTGNVGVPFYWQSLPHGNYTIHYVTITELPFPMLAPAYAIAGDKIVFGLSLQPIQMALNHMDAHGPGIRTRPDFAAVREKVSTDFGAVFYTDVKATFPQTHSALAMILGMVRVQFRGLGRGGDGPRIDMAAFPPADVFIKHLFGSIMVVRSEDNGIAVESYSPGNMAVGIVGVGAVVAAVAIPNVLRARLAANESAAVGSLRTIATQQAVFQAEAEIDQDKNERGEYGLLSELCGETPFRPNTTKRADPVYVSTGFATQGAAGTGAATKSGYHFRIYLPTLRTTGGDDKSLGGTKEQGGPAIQDAQGINLQEQHFIVYAWPVKRYSTGRRAFAVTEIGKVYSTKMLAKSYSGTNGPALQAAFPKDGNPAGIWLNDKLGETGNDGNRWVPEP